MQIVALVLGGLGAAIVARAGAAPLDRLVVRNGLGLLAFGLLCLAVGGAGNAIVLAAGSDPLSSAVVLFFPLGFLAAGVAVVILGVTLVRLPGPTRVVGAVLLAGILCFVLLVATVVTGSAPPVDGQAGVSIRGIIGAISALGLLIGTIGIGALALASSRSGSTGPV